MEQKNNLRNVRPRRKGAFAIVSALVAALVISLFAGLGTRASEIYAAGDNVTPVTLKLTASKSLTGEGLSSDALKTTYKEKFDFKVTPKDNAPTPSKATAKNSGSKGDAVDFGEIEFTGKGTYEYTVEETKGSDNNITYDTTARTLKVVVEEENGKCVIKSVSVDGNGVDVKASAGGDSSADADEVPEGGRTQYLEIEYQTQKFDDDNNPISGETVTDYKEEKRVGDYIVYCLDPDILKPFREDFESVEYNLSEKKVEEFIDANSDYADVSYIKNVLYNGYPNVEGEVFQEFSGAPSYFTEADLSTATKLAIWEIVAPNAKDDDIFRRSSYDMLEPLIKKIIETPVPTGKDVLLYVFDGGDDDQPVVYGKVVDGQASESTYSVSLTEFKNKYTKEENTTQGTLKTTVSIGEKSATKSAPVEVEEGTYDVVDTIDYTNLTAGAKYKVKGELYCVTDGKTVKTAEEVLTADKASGTWKITFKGVNVEAGKKYVVFEYAVNTADEKDNVNHRDEKDMAQTITVKKQSEPDTKEGSLKTTVSIDGNASTKSAPVEVEEGTYNVVDTIDYEGLVEGAVYTVNGTLVDKDGEVTVSTSEAKCTAETNGKGQWTITFKNVKLEAGKEYVVYEKAFTAGGEDKNATKDKPIKHENIDDKAQTVVVKEKKEEPTTSTDEQSTTSTDEQPTTSAEDQPTTSTEDQPTTSTDDQPTTSTEDQPTTSTDDQPTTSTDEQPATEKKRGSLATTVKAGDAEVQVGNAERGARLTIDETKAITTVEDTIYYTDLVEGAAYTVTGRLVEVDAKGNVVNDNVATNTLDLVAYAANGEWVMSFDVSDVELNAYSKYVVFESAFAKNGEDENATEDNPITHENVKDMAQSIYTEDEQGQIRPDVEEETTTPKTDESTSSDEGSNINEQGSSKKGTGGPSTGDSSGMALYIVAAAAAAGIAATSVAMRARRRGTK